MSIETSTTIHAEYFRHTKEHQSNYGPQTVVLMLVGSFYEIYGIKHMDTGTVDGSEIVSVCELCQLNIANKGQDKETSNPIIMAGFRDYQLEKYIDILTTGGYTVAVYNQDKSGTQIKRILHNIYSPGTYVSFDTDNSPKMTNYTMCIWFEQINDMIVYGVSVVNIFTGKSSLFEYETTFIMNPTTFDELERYVSIYCPSEVIIVSDMNPNMIQTIAQYIGLHTHNIHNISSNSEKAVRCSTQRYIRHIISEQFGDESYDICSEFNTHIMATQSLCFLLNFIKEHDTLLVRNIAIPEFNNTSDRLVLANHTLKQLNILDDLSDHSPKKQWSSVLSILNKCTSAMGRRLFKHQLLNPVFNDVWLNTEYEMTALLLMPNNYGMVDFCRKQLGQVRDLEKIGRQLVLRKLYPASIHQLHKSLHLIQQMSVCLEEFHDLSEYLQSAKNNTLPMIAFIDNHLNVDICSSVTSMTSFEENIIKPGVSIELDMMVEKHKLAKREFEMIRQYINQLFREYEKNPELDYIKVHETDKMGFSLQLTKRRADILKHILAEKLKQNPNEHVQISTHSLPLSSIRIGRATTSNVDLDIPLLTEICKEINRTKECMNGLIAKTYHDFLVRLEKDWFSELTQLATYSARLDVITNKAYIATQYHYCCPSISSANKSFVRAKGLRHCLIEHIQQNELYVTNDISLGKVDVDGMLLYGTNAVGKTSLIRALGISIIMAQAGLFVPCSEFEYKPYTAIFSRILGNDNIFKGLSTFAVEMSELRIILKMADQHSLILGDELCSGTETESALSIFCAGLMELHKKQSSFIFATHFHEIAKYDEIIQLTRLRMKHMSVSYDRESKCLVYDRLLKDGSGPRTYGLEVCKSLHLMDDFMEMAYTLRNKYYPESQGSLTQASTVYNANKLRGTCEVCNGQLGEEIHHLSPQKDADSKGFIGSFHKNHKANLISVCEACHLSLHRADAPLQKRKKTTQGYKLFDSE